jgi:DNA repair protein RadC
MACDVLWAGRMPLDASTAPLIVTSQLADHELLSLALDRSLRATAELMARFGGVDAVARAPLVELERASIPARRARQLHAAFELGRRSLARPLRRGDPYDSADRVARAMQVRLADREQEELHVLGLDVRKRLVTQFIAAVGNPAEVFVDPRDVFRPLVRDIAHGAIVVHNHPSGDPRPSDADRALTRQLGAAGTILGVQLVDHIIVGRDGTYSFVAHGEL